jgi:predicted GIY-YIG superfamily endonuclease
MEIYIIILLMLFTTSLITTILLIKNSRLKKSNMMLLTSLKKIEHLVQLSKVEEKDDEVHKENFIKFLSDSRDWAYQYIEDVQNSLTDFVDAIEPEIAYFDEYGLVGEAYPHYYSMKKISKEYKELKKLLPVNEDE